MNLNFFALSENADECIYIKVNIKKPSEKLNLSSTYFPLCHPSFFRRIIFAVRERTDCSASWRYWYGKTVDKEVNYIDINEEDIIIGQPCSIGVEGDNLIQDMISFFNETRFCDHVFPGKKIYFDEESEKFDFIDNKNGYSKKY